MMIIEKLLCGCFYRTETFLDRAGGPEERCPVHGLQSVIDHRRSEWHTKCTRCRVGKRHGAAKIYATNLATDHANRTGHIVNVMYYNDWEREPVVNPVATVVQPTLTDDLPPF